MVTSFNYVDRTIPIKSNDVNLLDSYNIVYSSLLGTWDRAASVLLGKIAEQRSGAEQDHLGVIPVNLRGLAFGMASQMHEIGKLFQDVLKCFLLGGGFICEQRLDELLPTYRCASL